MIFEMNTSYNIIVKLEIISGSLLLFYEFYETINGLLFAFLFRNY